MEYHAQPQVPLSHYDIRRYNKKEAWLNYWYQIDAILRLEKQRILEIGPGNKTVTDMLCKAGIEVVTVDIDSGLKPDVVASATSLPFEDNSFDAVLCSEVLEHLPFEKFGIALKELRRVTKRFVVLGLPNAGGVFRFDIKIPILPRLTAFCKLPFFWKTHVFNGEHYWETGKRGYSLAQVRKSIESSGFKILKDRINADDPAHWLMTMEKI